MSANGKLELSTYEQELERLQLEPPSPRIVSAMQLPKRLMNVIWSASGIQAGVTTAATA